MLGTLWEVTWLGGTLHTLHTLHIQLLPWYILLILSSFLDTQLKHAQSFWHRTR